MTNRRTITHPTDTVTDPTGTEVERNRAVVARFFAEVLNGGRVAAIDELTTEGYTLRASHLPGPVGRDGHKVLVQRIRTGFPDLAETVVEVVAEGDRVVTHLRGEGTHTGAFLGIPPTGRRVRFESVNIDRVEGGRIAERWLLSDGLGILMQLGVVPPLPAD